MADLAELDRAEVVKLAGASPLTGVANYFAQVSVTGSLQIAGEGIAGTPAGGVVTVQGVTNGTAIVTDDLASSPTGIAVPASAMYAGAKTPAGLLAGLNLDSAGNLLTNLGVLSATGSLTALNQAVTFTLTGQANAAFQLTGTWVGVVTFEASNDNANWTSIFSYRAGDNTLSPTVTNSTNNDVYRVSTAGFGFVRVRVSTYTSGTVVVTAFAVANTSGVILNASLPAGTNAIGTVKAQLQDNAGTAIVAYNGKILVAEIGNANTGSQGALTVGTTAALISSNGTSNLANRIGVSIYNNSTVNFYWGYTNAVTTTTGTPILPGQERGWPVGAAQNVYIIAASTGNNARVTEIA